MSSFQASPPQKKNGVVSVAADIKINLLSVKTRFRRITMLEENSVYNNKRKYLWIL